MICPECGAPLTISFDESEFVCDDCGTVYDIIIQTNNMETERRRPQFQYEQNTKTKRR